MLDQTHKEVYDISFVSDALARLLNEKQQEERRLLIVGRIINAALN
jgi:hypothetical protein